MEIFYKLRPSEYKENNGIPPPERALTEKYPRDFATKQTEKIKAI